MELVRSRGVQGDGTDRTKTQTQIFTRFGFTWHQQVNFSEILEFQCTRNGAQNLPFCPGSPSPLQELDFKELDFKELGVLGYSDLLGLGVLGYSDLLGLGVPDEWASRWIGFWISPNTRDFWLKETIRGDYSKETIRRSGAHDIFWSGT